MLLFLSLFQVHTSPQHPVIKDLQLVPQCQQPNITPTREQHVRLYLQIF